MMNTHASPLQTTLGRSNVTVSQLGFGTEHLAPTEKGNIASVTKMALSAGITYFDLVYNFKSFLDVFGTIIAPERKKIVLTGHLGSTEVIDKEGKPSYKKNRSKKRILETFEDLLKRLQTDYIDVAFLHYVDSLSDYERLFQKNGSYTIAQDLIETGQARAIGLSTHNPIIAEKVALNHDIHVLMYPVNLASHAVEGKQELLRLCQRENLGVVAMKPFAGGKLFQQNQTIQLGKFLGAGKAKHKLIGHITPTHCLSYVLSHPAVSTAVPGIRSTDELDMTLAYLSATDEEKDFAPLMNDLHLLTEGECVYCNHCLPCPEALNIGEIIRLVDMYELNPLEEYSQTYERFTVKASNCARCEACLERCFANVPILERLERAVTLFE